jgi:hypothetical protein
MGTDDCEFVGLGQCRLDGIARGVELCNDVFDTGHHGGCQRWNEERERGTCRVRRALQNIPYLQLDSLLHFTSLPPPSVLPQMSRIMRRTAAVLPRAARPTTATPVAAFQRVQTRSSSHGAGAHHEGAEESFPEESACHPSSPYSLHPARPAGSASEEPAGCRSSVLPPSNVS